MGNVLHGPRFGHKHRSKLKARARITKRRHKANGHRAAMSHADMRARSESIRPSERERPPSQPRRILRNENRESKQHRPRAIYRLERSQSLITQGKYSEVGDAYSSAHSFSRRIWSSSSGVKSFWMLKVLRISSGDLPLIMLATVLQPTSSRALMSR